MSKPNDTPTNASAGYEHNPAVNGVITHTDFASRDPDATRAWCTRMFGWTFMAPMPMGPGEYHMFQYSPDGGGGIRQVEGTESPSALPYVQVSDVHAAYVEALAAGAESVQPPDHIMEGVTIAIVKAPGGVIIGINGP